MVAATHLLPVARSSEGGAGRQRLGQYHAVCRDAPEVAQDDGVGDGITGIYRLGHGADLAFPASLLEHAQRLGRETQPRDEGVDVCHGSHPHRAHVIVFDHKQVRPFGHVSGQRKHIIRRVPIRGSGVDAHHVGDIFLARWDAVGDLDIKGKSASTTWV